MLALPCLLVVGLHTIATLLHAAEGLQNQHHYRPLSSSSHSMRKTMRQHRSCCPGPLQQANQSHSLANND